MFSLRTPTSASLFTPSETKRKHCGSSPVNRRGLRWGFRKLVSRGHKVNQLSPSTFHCSESQTVVEVRSMITHHIWTKYVSFYDTTLSNKSSCLSGLNVMGTNVMLCTQTPQSIPSPPTPSLSVVALLALWRQI